LILSAGKSITGALRPFETSMPGSVRHGRTRRRGENVPKTVNNGSEAWGLPQLCFPKWQRELFRNILDEENLKLDREGGRERLTACGG
jgi:hypothetical protein